MDVICSHVANGGTLIQLADQMGLRFGDMSNWIHSNEERDRRYKAALNDRGEWSQERVLQELRTLGLADITEIFNDEGGLKPISEWPESISRAVSSIEVFEEFEGRGENRVQSGWTKKVRFVDKSKALELLGKNSRLFNDKVELSGIIKLEDLVIDDKDDQ